MAKRKPKKRQQEPIKKRPKGGQKHTPGSDHNTKSGGAKKKRFAKKKLRQRENERDQCQEQWLKWDALSDDVKRLRPDLYPDCPRPSNGSESDVS